MANFTEEKEREYQNSIIGAQLGTGTLSRLMVWPRPAQTQPRPCPGFLPLPPGAGVE